MYSHQILYTFTNKGTYISNPIKSCKYVGCRQGRANNVVSGLIKIELRLNGRSRGVIDDYFSTTNFIFP